MDSLDRGESIRARAQYKWNTFKHQGRSNVAHRNVPASTCLSGWDRDAVGSILQRRIFGEPQMKNLSIAEAHSLPAEGRSSPSYKKRKASPHGDAKNYAFSGFHRGRCRAYIISGTCRSQRHSRRHSRCHSGGAYAKA